MTSLAMATLSIGVLVLLYPYIGYPVCLLILGRIRRISPSSGSILPDAPDEEWPRVSLTVPVYNEEGQIRELLESLLALDYPRDRLQILMVSDACSDGTERIIREFEGRGVELLSLSARSGKTAAENAAREHLRGDVVVNTDASVRIDPGAIRALMRALRDPSVGVASGRDLSVSHRGKTANEGEAGYVGYEMWVRRLETRVGGIVGASGCLYAIRDELHRIPVPEALSRDFISALNAREHGYSAVSVDDAYCYVPRTPSLRREYRRKVRTLTRGMATLLYKRTLLNPLRYGTFAWSLFSHKVARWLIPFGGLLVLGGVMTLAPSHAWAAWALGMMAGGVLLAGIPWALEVSGGKGDALPSFLTLPAYVLGGAVAAGHAALRVFLGRGDPVWEPTRRRTTGPVATSPSSDRA